MRNKSRERDGGLCRRAEGARLCERGGRKRMAGEKKSRGSIQRGCVREGGGDKGLEKEKKQAEGSRQLQFRGTRPKGGGEQGRAGEARGGKKSQFSLFHRT